MELHSLGGEIVVIAAAVVAAARTVPAIARMGCCFGIGETPDRRSAERRIFDLT